MDNKRNFEIVELGTTYNLPKYKVTEKGLELVASYDLEDSIDEIKYQFLGKQEITFVRGDKRTVHEIDFVNAVEELNEIAPYIGEKTFDISDKDWNRVYYSNAGMTSQEVFNIKSKKYKKCKDVIEAYLNPTPRVNGILHEQLLAMMIEDLRYKTTLVPSRETANVITKLQEALFWLEERQRDKDSRNVQGTYQK